MAPVRSSSSSSPYYDSDDWLKGGPVGAYSEYFDKRDSQVYVTILHDSKYYGVLEVFAQNLNYGTQVKYGEEPLVPGTKHCYNDDPLHCASKAGALYTWSAAMGFPPACDTVLVGSTPECPNTTASNHSKSIHQGVCPDGWHIMNEWDFTRLITKTISPSEITAQGFGSIYGNNTGFSALPAGVGENGKYILMGSVALFWFPEQSDSNMAKIARVYPDSYSNDAKNYKEKLFSVRCVRDVIE